MVIRACALLCALAACAPLVARRDRERALERELAASRAAQPIDVAWQEARRLLAERGYPLAGRDAAAVGQPPMGWAERIVSPARETSERGPLERSLDTGWSRARERYHVESRPSGDGWEVVFTRVDGAQGDRRGMPRRDLELELALLRRVDPAAAGRVDAALSDPGAASRAGPPATISR